MATPGFFAHPKALVDESADIGDGTRVWAFAHVMGGAIIGKDCNIGDYAFVERGARLGDHVTVKNGVQVWEAVTAEDGVFLGPSCVFTNDLWPRSFLKPPKESWLRPTLLREGCTIGAGATIVCGHTIGRFAFVAAGALVTRDVPDYALMLGAPAGLHAWICRCTTKLEFQERAARCPKCDRSYQLAEDGRSVSERMS